MLNIALCLFYSAICMALVFCGITFLNGQLMPSVLSGLYQAVPSPFMRMLIGLLPFWGVGNYMAGKAFALAGPAWGGAGVITFSVVFMTITAMLIDEATLNAYIFLGFFICLAGGLMVVYGINSQ